MKVFTGSSNPALAQEIVDYLKIDLGRCVLKRFSDGEIRFYIDENVRGEDIFIIQSGSSDANSHLMELFLMIDAFKRSSAGRITAVIPYYPYARQDWKDKPRVPISARLVSDLIEKAGANRVLTMDLHSPQIQGFFSIPVDNLMAAPVLANHIKTLKLEDLTIVSPDAGGVGRARVFAERLNARLAIIDKRRPAPNLAKVLHVIGEVADRNIVIFDDMVDTAGTLDGERRGPGREAGQADLLRLHPPGPVGAGPGQHRRLEAGTPVRDQYDTADGRGRPHRPLLRPIGRRALRRGDPEDQRGELGQLPVRLRRT